MAIDRAVWIALRPRLDRTVHVHSLDFASEAHFGLDDLRKEQGWPEYLKGIAFVFQSQGFGLSGWEGVIAGDIPQGAGLSSSAAIEMAAARAFTAVSDLDWDNLRVAKMGQQAENQWIGLQSGLMDQMASAAAREGHALFLDCRSLEYRHVPLPEGISVVVMDTSTRRGLIDSAYNERRAQCESAAQALGVPSLRDLGAQEFDRRSKKLDEVIRKRARHVITENQRVLDFLEALLQGRLADLGRLLKESHLSLRDDFEVSNAALNQMVECAWTQPGCYGARLTGAGFGGCAVALVESGTAENFAAAVAECYRRSSGLEPQVYLCRASEGARAVKIGT
jgi:galactokinase